MNVRRDTCVVLTHINLSPSFENIENVGPVFFEKKMFVLIFWQHCVDPLRGRLDYPKKRPKSIQKLVAPQRSPSVIST